MREISNRLWDLPPGASMWQVIADAAAQEKKSALIDSLTDLDKRFPREG